MDPHSLDRTVTGQLGGEQQCGAPPRCSPGWARGPRGSARAARCAAHAKESLRTTVSCARMHKRGDPHATLILSMQELPLCCCTS